MLPAPARDTMRSRVVSLARIDVVFPAVVVLAFLLFGSLGVSGSSLAELSASGRSSSGVIIGDTKHIRSDEYRVWSPVRIGRVEADFARDATFGLGREQIGNTWRPMIPS